MKKEKNNRKLNLILVIIILLLIIVLALISYNYYKNKKRSDEAQSKVYEFIEMRINNSESIENEEVQYIVEDAPPILGYDGYNIIGVIEIPNINIKYPILSEATKDALKRSIGFAYGVGLNQNGNTLLLGHNYKHGAFFGNLKKLKNGDKIYITDLNRDKIEYIVYNMYITTFGDKDFMLKQPEEKEITLRTCTTNGKGILIIEARH